MSEDIRKEPVSPLSAEPPRDRPRNPEGGFDPAPPFPRMAWAVGAIWIVCGGLVILSLLGLLLVTTLWLASPDKGALVVHLGAWMAGCTSIPLGLFAVVLLLVGARTMRGTAAGMSGSAVCSVVIGGLFLVSGLGLLINGSFNLWSLPTALFNGSYEVQFAVEKLTNTAPLLLIGALLLTAGCLALAGRSQYELWRKAQKARQAGDDREANPFRK